MAVFKAFLEDNEFGYTVEGPNKIVIVTDSEYQEIPMYFQLTDDNDSYEYYAPVLTDIPQKKRPRIAEAAISEAYRELTPTMPSDEKESDLYVFSSRRGLLKHTELDIREMILDAMGRVASYDNEKRPVFCHILHRPLFE